MRTHCINGHEYTPENTALYRRGHTTRRVCRICKRDEARRRYHRSKGRVITPPRVTREPKPPRQTRVSHSVSAEAELLLRQIIEADGISATRFIEGQIRSEAARRGFVVTPSELAEFKQRKRGTLVRPDYDTARALADAAFGGVRFSG